MAGLWRKLVRAEEVELEEAVNDLFSECLSLIAVTIV